MMGLKTPGVIVANPETLVSIGHLTSHGVLLGVLAAPRHRGHVAQHSRRPVLVSIVVTTLLGWMLGDVHYTRIVSAPPAWPAWVGRNRSVVPEPGHGRRDLLLYAGQPVWLLRDADCVTDKAESGCNGKFRAWKQSAVVVDSV